jgi:hypothetical protein
MSEKYPKRRSAAVPVDKSTASPAKANPFWKVASEKFVTCGLLVLLVLLPPQPISARAKDAAPAKGIKRPRDLKKDTK